MDEKELARAKRTIMCGISEAKMLMDAIMFLRHKKGLTREQLSNESCVRLSVIEDMEEHGKSPNLTDIILILRALDLRLTFTKYIGDAIDI